MHYAQGIVLAATVAVAIAIGILALNSTYAEWQRNDRPIANDGPPILLTFGNDTIDATMMQMVQLRQRAAILQASLDDPAVIGNQRLWADAWNERNGVRTLRERIESELATAFGYDDIYMFMIFHSWMTCIDEHDGQLVYEPTPYAKSAIQSLQAAWHARIAHG